MKKKGNVTGMIRVIVSYSRNEAVTFSFWKCFFQSCGIWVTEKIIDSKKIYLSKSPRLFILGNEDSSIVKEQVIPNCAYIVKENTNFRQLLNSRKQDVFSIKHWYNDDIHNFSKIIPQLFSGMTGREEISKLLKVYIDVKMWQYIWLFQEITLQQECEFDREIDQVCSKALAMLNQLQELRGNWNYEYTKLYYQYIKYWVNDRSLLSRVHECEELLKKCRELASVDGWNPSLCILAGKICELSPTENKSAINYYKSAVEYEKQAPISYDIGKLYEKVYGDRENAFLYYQLSAESNKNYYRAPYKIAMFMEEKEQWMDALKIYYEIKKQLGKVEFVQGISIFDIEYYYKCCWRILRIYQRNVNDVCAIEQYKNELQTMNTRIMENKTLDKLIKCMVGNKQYKEKRIKILNIAENRIKINCGM